MILDLTHVLEDELRLLDGPFNFRSATWCPVVLGPMIIQALTTFLDHCTVLHFRDLLCSWLWSLCDVLLVDITKKYHARPLIGIPAVRISWLYFFEFVGALSVSILGGMRSLKCLLCGLLRDQRIFETVSLDVIERWLCLCKHLSFDSFRFKRSILFSCGESRPLLQICNFLIVKTLHCWTV